MTDTNTTAGVLALAVAFIGTECWLLHTVSQLIATRRYIRWLEYEIRIKEPPVGRNEDGDMDV